MKAPRDYTVKKLIESYGSYYVDYDGLSEVNSPRPMTFKQARYLAKTFGGYVVTLDPIATGYGMGVYLS